jgi:hypothetical protein
LCSGCARCLTTVSADATRAPEIIQMISDTIDEALTDLANSFKLLGG